MGWGKKYLTSNILLQALHLTENMLMLQDTNCMIFSLDLECTWKSSEIHKIFSNCNEYTMKKHLWKAYAISPLSLFIFFEFFFSAFERFSLSLLLGFCFSKCWCNHFFRYVLRLFPTSSSFLRYVYNNTVIHTSLTWS